MHKIIFEPRPFYSFIIHSKKSKTVTNQVTKDKEYFNPDMDGFVRLTHRIIRIPV